MPTYEGEARGARTLAQIVEDATAALVQDASEYGIVGLTGGVAACFVAVILRLLHQPVSDALIAPAVLAIAMLTLATSAEAFARLGENLQPDAAAAFGAISRRLATHVWPAAVLGAFLFVAVLALGLFGGDVGVWPSWIAAIAILGVAIAYIWPRSFYGIALVAGVRTPGEASVVSAALVRACGAQMKVAWCIVGLPTIVVGLFGLAAGFGPLSTGVAALVSVASMPLAAGVLSLLFSDASAQMQRAVAPAKHVARRKPPLGAPRTR